MNEIHYISVPAAGTPLRFHHTHETTAPPEAVWRLWTHVPTWKEWDGGLDDARIEGDDLARGKSGLVVAGGREIPFHVSEHMEGEASEIVTALPLARLVVRRTFASREPTRFRHDVHFEGVLAPFFALLLGRRFRRILPRTMASLAELAERS